MKIKELINFIKEYGLILLVVIGPIIGFIFLLFLKPDISISKKQVHWHIPISYNLCGDTTQLKDSGKHGKLHGHDDNQAHVEGIVDMENRNETLGAFFDTTNITFSKNQIGKYKTGDKCEGSDIPGKIFVLVNGKENFEFRNYILNDKDDIKIFFK